MVGIKRFTPFIGYFETKFSCSTPSLSPYAIKTIINKTIHSLTLSIKPKVSYNVWLRFMNTEKASLLLYF